MPVYLRKNLNFTPPSIQKIEDEDDDDYVQDPEQLRDVLPQPYRMIDKILGFILDDTWDIITAKDEDLLRKANKIRAPQYECSICVQTNEKATAMCDSGNGQYIFIGHPNGLSVMESSTQNIVCTLEESGVEITQMSACPVDDFVYIIATIDDMGVSRLYDFTENQLYLIKVFNEPEGGTKTIVNKCELSLGGDYAGVYVQNPANQEVWLDVYKLPKDNWLKEFEVLHPRDSKQNVAEKTAQETDNENATEVAASSVDGTETVDTTSEPPSSHRKGHTCDATQPERPKSKKKRRSPSPRVKGKKRGNKDEVKPATPPPILSGEKGAQKFSAPQIVMKIKPPAPLTGCHMTSLAQACKNIDTGDVVGMGHNHIVTQTHLEQRDCVFNHLHENLLRYLPKEDEEASPSYIQPYFHFLTAGRLDPTGLEYTDQAGKPTSIAVWWTNSTDLLHYSLLKASKDLEHKPDLVWPFSCKITSTSLSPCSSHIAVGLENGNVVLWNRYFGIGQGVVNVSDTSSIKELQYLDPSIYPQEYDNYPPYPSKKSTYLLVLCGDGSLHILDVGSTGSNNKPVCIIPSCDNDSEAITFVHYLKTLPELLIIILRNGTVFLRDIFEQTMLCEMKLPESHTLTSPWEPIIAIGGGGQMMFARGDLIEDDRLEEQADTEGKPEDKSSLFGFQLRSFPSLDSYWMKEREFVSLNVHTTVEERIKHLIQERISQQALRKTRMQMRWGMLRQEIDIVRQCREAAKKRTGLLQTFSEEDCAPTPMIR